MMSDDPSRFDPPPDDSDDQYWSGTQEGAPDDQYGYEEGHYYEPSDAYLTGDEEAVAVTASSSPSWGGRLLALAGIIIVIIVVLLLIRACGTGSGAEQTPEPNETVSVGITPQQTLPAAPDTTPESTPVPGETAVAPTTAPPSTGTFPIGSRVQVANTDGGGMRFRTGPGSTYVTIAILDDGTVLKVVGGPEESDDFVWWRLQAVDGTIGWGAEDFLEPATG